MASIKVDSNFIKKKYNRRGFLTGAFSTLFVFTLFGCEPNVRRRPYGYLRAGFVKDFLNVPETIDEEKWIIVRVDEKGLSAMSTLCTKELNQVTFDPDGNLTCDLCESRYKRDGTLISGSAKEGLPYYEMEVSSLTYKNREATLYVILGKEVNKEWRLPIRTDS